MKFDVPELAIPSPSQVPPYEEYGSHATYQGAFASGTGTITLLGPPASGFMWHIKHAFVNANTTTAGTTQTIGITCMNTFLCIAYATANGCACFTYCDFYTINTVAISNSTIVSANGGVIYRQEPIV